MKRIRGFRFPLAVFAALVFCGAAAWADPPSQVGRLSLISGSVSFHPGSLDEWAPAVLNYPLTAGDHLWTDTGSRAGVHLRSAAIRLNGDTEFSFLGLDDQAVQVRVPPEDVQATMNKVVKAENEKVAAIDFATATETMADGTRRAEIKKAQGVRQAKILEAEGEAQAIKLVNEAADKYFVGNAQLLRRLIAVESALSANAKIVIPSNTELVNVIGEMAGILPWKKEISPVKT